MGLLLMEENLRNWLYNGVTSYGGESQELVINGVTSYGGEAQELVT